MKNIFYLIIALTLLILPAYGLAQERKSGIQIAPITFNYEILPGGSQKAKVNLKNLGEEEIEYILETENFTATTEDGAPVFAFGPTTEGITTLADWFEFPQGKTGKLGPKESTDIWFNINIPEGAEPGGHYAAIFAKVAKKTQEGKTELGVSSRVGSLVLVTVPGEIKEEVEIEELKIPRLVWGGPVDIKLKVKNTGTVHYDSQADVEIKSMFGKQVKINLGKHTVLPSSSRAYEGKWNNRYPFGVYRITATATGGGANPAVQMMTLYAIPLKLAIPILVAILVIIVIARYLKKKYKIVSK